MGREHGSGVGAWALLSSQAGAQSPLFLLVGKGGVVEEALRLSFYMEIHFITERSPSTSEFCQ